jgi:V/A-type H+/Na+-transporting ATPase subunit D
VDKKIISGTRPTRIELLKLRRREILAQKAHDLLDEKLDAMVGEFLAMVEEYQNTRESLNHTIRGAYGSLIEAQMVMGTTGVQESAHLVYEMADVPMSVRHVMGVKVPLVQVPSTIVRSGERGYSLTGTSALVDETAARFEGVLRDLLILSEKEVTLRRLSLEIEKTRRRVKALENVLIPRLKETQKYIEMHLEELAREDLFRRKMVKVLQKGK